MTDFGADQIAAVDPITNEPVPEFEVCPGCDSTAQFAGFEGAPDEEYEGMLWVYECRTCLHKWAVM